MRTTVRENVGFAVFLIGFRVSLAGTSIWRPGRNIHASRKTSNSRWCLNVEQMNLECSVSSYRVIGTTTGYHGYHTLENNIPIGTIKDGYHRRKLGPKLGLAPLCQDLAGFVSWKLRTRRTRSSGGEKSNPSFLQGSVAILWTNATWLTWTIHSLENFELLELYTQMPANGAQMCPTGQKGSFVAIIQQSSRFDDIL